MQKVKAFPLRGRWREAPDEVAQDYEFAGSPFNSQLLSAHLISLASLDSFPSRGSLGRSRASASPLQIPLSGGFFFPERKRTAAVAAIPQLF
ncbi:MAG: hypothetical protein ACI4PT_02035 [Candidatus Avoscillospira sp.]